MFHPVGSQPPSVYWRRRLLVFGSIALLVVLLVLTVHVATSGGDNAVGPGAGTTPNPSSSTPSTPRTTQAAKTSTKASSKHSTPSRPRASSTPPARCGLGDLGVAAVVAKPSYRVGDHPMVELQVTNNGAKPCIQDLADKQIELKVYNGESRVWGSHDCEIQNGADDRTLAVGRAVRVSITWSGLTSQPKCAGTRQRVGAGTYTLYALLSGKTGKAAQFSIT
jgi:hypothetical protein